MLNIWQVKAEPEPVTFFCSHCGFSNVLKLLFLEFKHYLENNHQIYYQVGVTTMLLSWKIPLKYYRVENYALKHGYYDHSNIVCVTLEIERGKRKREEKKKGSITQKPFLVYGINWASTRAQTHLNKRR